MPYLLILLTLVFASCRTHKPNALSEPGFKGSLEQRTFITVRHEEGQSVLRNKILNSFVEEKYPTDNLATKIISREELIGYEMDARELNSYSQKEQTMAKIVVSYTDRIEIYYLPENVPFDIIPSKLSLAAEPNRSFRWVPMSALKTIIGETYYLASVNVDDVVVNDQKFYDETIVFNNEFAGKVIKFSPGKLLEYEISFEVYQQGEAAQGLSSMTRCGRDTRESGDCGQCTYVRNFPAGNYNRTADMPVDSLGLAVRVGDRSFNVSQFNPVTAAGNFSFKINAADYDLKNEVDVEVQAGGVAGVSSYSANYGYSGYCPNQGGGEQISLARSVSARVSAKIKGRGLEALKNVL